MGINLKELEQKLNECLHKETPESLREWLNKKREEERLADAGSNQVEAEVGMPSELLPCPFCGSKNISIEGQGEYSLANKDWELKAVTCNDCNCWTDEYLTKEIATEHWNKRASQ